jgi:hypothetical protein
MIDKEKQRELLKEIIQADEKDGLYNDWDVTLNDGLNEEKMIQSSIEWLYDRFLFAGYAIPSEWKEQAKEMHKDEIIDAFRYGNNNEILGNKHPEEYYNDTFTK